MVSIIVPIYNVEPYLTKCVNTCLAQTYADLEVILVDDGSPDGSPAICDSYANTDCRVRVIHKENGGLLSARLAGLAIATGTWVMFVDGDDWIEPDCVERCVKAADDYKVDLVCCGARYIYHDHVDLVPVNAREGYYSRKDIETEIYPFLIEDSWGRRFSMSAWGKLFNSELLRKAYRGVDTRITIGEDAVIVRPYIMLCNTIYILDDFLCDYNNTNITSMTRSKKPMSWENARLVYERQLEVFGGVSEDFSNQVRRNYVHNLFITGVSQFNDRDAAVSTILKKVTNALSDAHASEFACNLGYRSLSHYISALCVRHHCVLIMYLYWKFAALRSS